MHIYNQYTYLQYIPRYLCGMVYEKKYSAIYNLGVSKLLDTTIPLKIFLIIAPFLFTGK